MTIALFGHTGFVGGAILEEAAVQGLPVAKIPLPRVHASTSNNPLSSAHDWLNANDRSDRLMASISGCDAVVIAAGLADAASGDEQLLWAANVLLPAVAVEIARRACVTRVVHISSAAVQGSRPVLDDTTITAPRNAYARSKVSGEQLVLSAPGLDATVYRPTSVQGFGRPMTMSLRHLKKLWVLPVVNGGRRTIPFALVQNVAAVALELAVRPIHAPVVLHPDEDIRIRDVIDWFAPKSTRIPLSGGLAEYAARAAHKISDNSNRLEATVRRAELLLVGQRVCAHEAARAGIALRYGRHEWERLVERIMRPDAQEGSLT